MLNKKFFILIALIAVFCSSIAWAQTAVSVREESNVIVVENVPIDKTDDNAVMARTKAIEEAKDAAFKVLLESVLEKDELSHYKMPAHDVISGYVSDFEIKGEKLSSKRYKADFIVRFNKDVMGLIKPDGSAALSADDAGLVKSGSVMTGTVLILPYYKNFFGKEVLWDEPNPWRNAWQASNGATVVQKIKLLVPSGSETDVNSGDAAAVWSGEYSVLDKLKANYNATNVMVVLAEKTEDNISVKIYGYNDGSFDYKKTLSVPFEGGDYSPAVSAVIDDKELFLPASYFEKGTTADKDAAAIADNGGVPSSSAAVVTSLEVTLHFSDAKEWMETRKILNTIEPRPEINILSINSSSVRFAIDANSDDDMTRIVAAIKSKGFELVPQDVSNQGYILRRVQ